MDSKARKEKIDQVIKVLEYVLTCEDIDITLATIEQVIDLLKEID